jgi:hypothetical protein
MSRGSDNCPRASTYKVLQQMARTHQRVRRGAVLARNRPWSDERNCCEVGGNAWTAAAPCARGTTWKRFQPQRVERALGSRASRLTKRLTNKSSVCTDIR